jgi:hypothetical protein
MQYLVTILALVLCFNLVATLPLGDSEVSVFKVDDMTPRNISVDVLMLCSASFGVFDSYFDANFSYDMSMSAPCLLDDSTLVAPSSIFVAAPISGDGVIFEKVGVTGDLSARARLRMRIYLLYLARRGVLLDKHPIRFGRRFGSEYSSDPTGDGPITTRNTPASVDSSAASSATSAAGASENPPAVDTRATPALVQAFQSLSVAERRDLFDLLRPDVASSSRLSAHARTYPKVTTFVESASAWNISPPFQPSNWKEWSASFKAVLPHQLQDLLSGVEVEPTLSIDVIDDEHAAYEEALHERYCARNATLYRGISHCLINAKPSSCLGQIGYETTGVRTGDGVAAWNQLVKIYERPTMHRQLAALTVITRDLTIRDGESLMLYRDRVVLAYADLSRLLQTSGLDKLAPLSFLMGLSGSKFEPAAEQIKLSESSDSLTVQGLYERISAAIPDGQSSKAFHASAKSLGSLQEKVASLERALQSATGSSEVLATSTKKVWTLAELLPVSKLPKDDPKSRPTPEEKTQSCKRCRQTGHCHRTCFISAQAILDHLNKGTPYRRSKAKATVVLAFALTASCQSHRTSEGIIFTVDSGCTDNMIPSTDEDVLSSQQS